ncbi:MAG: hypothetical protein RLY71_762 [Pseudomonadota bacterium]|jgi:hypothetical protein
MTNLLVTRRHQLGIGLLATVLLSSCGGGIYLGWSDTGDAPPDVNLAASPNAASPGSTVRLIAAASDDYAVSRVEFYRIEPGGGSAFLGQDGRAPYQLDTVLPDGARGSVSYYAIAVDDVGQSTSSRAVSVTLLP